MKKKKILYKFEELEWELACAVRQINCLQKDLAALKADLTKGSWYYQGQPVTPQRLNELIEQIND